MTQPLLLMLAVVAATWDAWRWYADRIATAPEEGAALALTIAFLFALRWRSPATTPVRTPLPLWTLSALLLLYAFSFGTLPPIGRAALAVLATLLCLYRALIGRQPPIAFWGLVALSLPVLPSLQFALGFGMRVVSAAATVVLLRAQGFDVSRQGTFLLWQGEMVQFDAPCSGVNMLWAGLLVAFMGSLAQRFGIAKTAGAVTLSVALTLVGNVLRAASLFLIETGHITGLPAWSHEAVGIAAFLLSAAGVMWGLHSLEPKSRMA